MTQTQNVLLWLRRLSGVDIARSRLNKKARDLAEMTLEMESLRSRLPTAILQHYDQRRARGKPCVVPISNGVCGACHLKLPSGRASDLRRTEGSLSVCDNCGAFIYQDETEIPVEQAEAAPSRSAPRRPAPAPRKPKSKS